MDEKLSESAAGRRFDTTLLAAFGIIALLLAAMGIFAVVAHSVAQRTREMGIRLALGASPEMIVALIVREGMTMPGLGLLIGVAGALALTRAIRSALYGVTATNPAVYAVLIALFTALAALACYLPARRASRVDPVLALQR
jgi:putative ABC transport system permease protein